MKQCAETSGIVAISNAGIAHEAPGGPKAILTCEMGASIRHSTPLISQSLNQKKMQFRCSESKLCPQAKHSVHKCRDQSKKKHSQWWLKFGMLVIRRDLKNSFVFRMLTALLSALVYQAGPYPTTWENGPISIHVCALQQAGCRMGGQSLTAFR